MTRQQTKDLAKVIQKSAKGTDHSGPSSSTTVPTSSSFGFFRDNFLLQSGGNGTIGTGFLSGIAGSDMMTSFEDGVLQKGDLNYQEGMTSTDDDRIRAEELGLAPSPSPRITPSPPGFFDSSQDTPHELHRNEVLSEKESSSRQRHNLEVVIEQQKPSTSRSNDTATPAKATVSSESTMTPLTRKQQAKGSESRKKKSAAPSERSTSIAEDVDVEGLSTSTGRPKRGAGKPVKYTPEWNADGTEIKRIEKRRSGSAKETRKESSKATSSSSRKGEQASDVIVIDDEEEELSARQAVAESDKLGQERYEVENEQDESITMVDDGSDEDEEEVVSSRSKGKGKARKSAAIVEDVDMNSDEEESEPELPKRRVKSKTVKTPDRSMDHAIERSSTNAVPEVLVETPTSKGKREKKPKKPSNAKSMQVIPDEEEEEEESKDNTHDVSLNTAVDEEEEEKQDEQVQLGKTIKAKAKVLADASAAVNAGRREIKHDEVKKSSTSTPKPKSSLLDAAKRLWGKPLSSILGANQHRSPGLAKRKIAPLLAIRNEPPPKRAAIPIPKSRQKNKDEELDSEEEEIRANETAEQRMARYIREQDEGDD